MNLRSILLGVLITLSTLLSGFFGIVKAEEAKLLTNSKLSVLQPRVEYVWIDGVLWKIVYDADDNVIQASAVGHSE